MPNADPHANHSTAAVPLTYVIGGVDTHADTHTVAAVDSLGRRLGTAQFPAEQTGYHDLTAWLRGHGTIKAVGVEGTGSYGAGLTRWLSHAGITVVEVNRPNRADRRRRGKSDPVDAENAATAVLAGAATATPKDRTGAVEAIRMVHSTRATAIKARTAAINGFISLLRTSPDQIRDPLVKLTRPRQLATARTWRSPSSTDPAHTAKHCLHRLADRIHTLTEEIKAADTELRDLTTATAPRLLDRLGVGPETAAQLLITAGDNPERITTEAAFAALCGTSPVPASSGKTLRHRLNRGGDRQANRALHMIMVTRLRYDPATRAYIDKRGGHTNPHLMRCLKRSIAREIWHLITNPEAPDQTPTPTPAQAT